MIGRHRNWLLLGGAALILAAVVAWRLLFLPDALDFAGGTRVSLEDYGRAGITGVPEDLAKAAPLARGEYLAEAADCAACHTAKGGKPFAGGRPFKLPFGTIYTPNITPDRETGIGAWTNAEFLRAVHKGVGRNGERLYPAFPYASYTMLTDADVLAIRKYLGSLPAVRQANIPNTFAFPFNQRWLMAIWGAFFNSDRRFEPVRERSAQWNRGAYLVEAAGHCGECHTPRTLMQAMDTRHKFAGGQAEGWNAYNITGDRLSGIGQWTDAELTQYLAKGHAEGRGVASGPMAEAVALSTSRLTRADIAAMVSYLRTIPPIRTKASPAMAGPAPAAANAGPSDNTPGKRIFEGACASCHAWSGQGAITSDQQLTGNRAVNDGSASNVAMMILHGTGGSPERPGAYMPAFASAYSDAEIANVANYVTARFGAKPSRITAADVKRMREE
ncbi:cytochrome c (plasmid) [Novosphingobium resinovorum]|uniref:c-type cytochrome n=1 Tax=Novosphingobium TaxID=165696 RepID=UPI001B3C845E|nr:MULTISPECIES: cytochrome c [Novosphingobium]MBF7015039.1 cytochrome c [Novosphingobium sp. HR1a]WJM29723.1 cytochrome c [Novosphingobium resinovorum]